jgi:hypothetical protein
LQRKSSVEGEASMDDKENSGRGSSKRSKRDKVKNMSAVMQMWTLAFV